MIISEDSNLHTHRRENLKSYEVEEINTVWKRFKWHEGGVGKKDRLPMKACCYQYTA
jgi:hypothetical protein